MLYGVGFEFRFRGSETLWWPAFPGFSLMLQGIWICPIALWNHWASLFQAFSLKCLKVYEQGMKSLNPLRASTATGEFVVLGDLCREYEISEILYCLCSNVWVGGDIRCQCSSCLEFYGACFPSINSEKFWSLTSTCEVSVYVRGVYGLCSEEKSFAVSLPWLNLRYLVSEFKLWSLLSLWFCLPFLSMTYFGLNVQSKKSVNSLKVYFSKF